MRIDLLKVKESHMLSPKKKPQNNLMVSLLQKSKLTYESTMSKPALYLTFSPLMYACMGPYNVRIHTSAHQDDYPTSNL
jgi:hypothetical protein